MVIKPEENGKILIQASGYHEEIYFILVLPVYALKILKCLNVFILCHP